MDEACIWLLIWSIILFVVIIGDLRENLRQSQSHLLPTVNLIQP